MPKKNSRIISAIDAQQWLITDEYLALIRDIALRENDYEAFLQNSALSQELNSFDALLVSHDGPVKGTSAVRHGSNGVIPIIGPIFPRANLFTQISGATSIDVVARDTRAVAEQGLRPVLYISSPGGAVEGVSEYADMVAGLDCLAVVSGVCASAAYWIASQASSIIVADTAVVGNIGVKTGKPDEDDAIVSKNAPNKKINAKAAQGIVNDIESVFLKAVAKGRGVTVEHVIENFGQGGVFVGQKAVDAGLADGVATLDAALNFKRSKKGVPMSKAEGDISVADHEKAVAEARTAGKTEGLAEGKSDMDAKVSEATVAGATEERTRIKSILEHGTAEKKPVAAMSLAMTTSLSLDEAKASLAGMGVENTNSLAASMNGSNPNITDSGEEGGEPDQAAIDASWGELNKGAA